MTWCLLKKKLKIGCKTTLSEVNGYVRATIDKLEGIRGDLVRMDDDWQEWKFPNLIEALRKWTERNPIKKPEGQPPTA